MISDGTNDYYYHFDGLSSVTNLTNSTGSTVETYSYDVYGQPSIYNAEGLQTPDSSYQNRFMFTGREYDPETGLYYYRARYYSPTIGRFLQRDPIGYYGGINLYTYCYNDPINFFDPWGLDVTVLNDSDGAFGFGHNGMGIGNDTTGWDYYSQDGPGAGGGHHEHYNSYDEMMADQSSRYDRSYRIPSTPEQDRKMRDYAEKNLNNPYSANPFNPRRYHCGDLVNGALEAGGIPHGRESFGNPPDDSFEKTKKANPANGANKGKKFK